MNKVFNINLGGSPLTIDDDAYKYLENYLQSLHNHFRQSEGYEEIMSDIEARLGELLREGMGKRSIATMQDVKNTVSVMGTPEDFGAESIDNQQDTQKKSAHTVRKDSFGEGGTSGGIKTGKRLFRDDEDKMIGGVCSGIAAYFGLESPTWVRLAFAAMFFFFGTGAGLYIIMMMIIPKASTTADRLAMKGEPIDVNTIAKAVEKGVESLSEKVNEFGRPENQEKFNSHVKNMSNAIGGAISYTFTGLGKGFKIVAGIIAIILVISILIAWVSAAIGIGWAYPFFGYITDSNILPKLAMFNAFWIIAVPTVAIIFFIRRIFFKGQRINSGFQIGMWSFFTVNLFCLASIIGRFTSEFNHETHTTQNIELPNSVQVLNISKLDNNYSEPTTHIGKLQVSEEFLLSRNVYFYIEKSPSDNFELVKTVHSNGKTSTEAGNLAQSVDYKMVIDGNDLKLSKNFMITKGTKWRGQQVQITLKVPVGKRLKIDREVFWGHFHSINYDELENQGYCWDEKIAYWEMTEKGIKCLLPRPKEEEEDN